jgi:hypothetical protein
MKFLHDALRKPAVFLWLALACGPVVLASCSYMFDSGEDEAPQTKTTTTAAEQQRENIAKARIK